MKYNILACLVLSGTLLACGAEQAHDPSTTSEILRSGGWNPAQSPYNLAPFSTIGVCDTGVKKGVKDYVKDAVHIWLKAGGREGLIKVFDSCSQGDRIIKLVRVSNDVNYYGQVAPLQGKTYVVSVPDKWAGRWTANHEVGHIFGFGHIFDGTVSIMNSQDNGRFMNRGELAAYDYAEVKHLLSQPTFKITNKKWDTARRPATVTAVAEERRANCVGANGITVYEDGTVTTYQGNTYTCSDGRWIFSAGIR
jgi:hypothetical protein